MSQLDSLAVPGTVLIFDELYSALHEFRAFRDYTSAFLRTLRPIGRSDDVHGRVAFVFE